MTQKTHVDDFLLVEKSSACNVGVLRWKYSRNLESPKVSSLGFENDTKKTKMSVGATVLVNSRCTLPNEDWYLAIMAKLSRRSTASDLAH
ncbi:hypothetical protein TNCV_1223591 [Trichonephila clavipes]|nr:hypothetical protein TNCV_1223591 [Trichonephila clavipes]